jgi:hypothetical protein
MRMSARPASFGPLVMPRALASAKMATAATSNSTATQRPQERTNGPSSPRPNSICRPVSYSQSPNQIPTGAAAVSAAITIPSPSERYASQLNQRVLPLVIGLPPCVANELRLAGSSIRRSCVPGSAYRLESWQTPLRYPEYLRKRFNCSLNQEHPRHIHRQATFKPD